MNRESDGKMTCEEFDRLAGEFLVGDVIRALTQELKDHLADCDRCRREWAGLLALVEPVRAELPAGRTWEDLAAETRWKLVRAAREEERGRHIPVLPFVVAILAGILTIALLPAGVLAAADLVTRSEIFGMPAFWKYYGIAVAVEIILFHLQAGMLIPLLKFPLRPRGKRHAGQIRMQVF